MAVWDFCRFFHNLVNFLHTIYIYIYYILYIIYIYIYMYIYAQRHTFICQFSFVFLNVCFRAITVRYCANVDVFAQLSQ